METQQVTAAKLQPGDKVLEIREVLTVVKSERHPTHARYQLVTLAYPDGEPWHGFTTTREDGMVRRYDKVVSE